jgi:PAS domain S-box-containing protein
MRTRFLRCVCAIAFLLLFFSPGPRSHAVDASKDNTRPAKTVLILYSFTARDAMDDFSTLQSTLRSDAAGPITFQVEYLESLRFEKPGYEKALADSLAATYRGQKIDLVMTALYPALKFAIDYREQIFPGAPIVFFAVSPKRLEDQKHWTGVTGVTLQGDVKGTVDLALELQPDTKYIALIGGDSAYERYWLAAARQDIQGRKSGPKTINLEGLPPDQLLEKIDELPPHTAALSQTLPKESLQPTLGLYKLLTVIGGKLPTYCLQNYCMGHGVIGGSYADFSEQGVRAAEIGARVLSGQRAEDIPVITGSPALPHVDWRELRRWSIPERALPAGTIVLYKEPRFWRRIRPTLPEAILLMVIGIIVVLIGFEFPRHYLQRRKYRGDLRQEEERFRGVTNALSLLIWMSDAEGRITYVNEAMVNFVGEDSLHYDWRTRIHAEDVVGVSQAIAEATRKQAGVSEQFRLRRADGVYRWVRDVGTPRVDADGSFAGLIGYACDITDQKMAQEALQDVGGRLIEAQEQERSRIARELHDDIGQKLALLSMELELSKRACYTPGGLRESRIEELRQRCSGIATDVQTLSHELHSSRLDYLGLTVALQSFCHEFAQQQNVNVDLRCEEAPESLPKGISLSLFRICQEGLHNSLKHSGADRFSIVLRGRDNGVELEISDTGDGFDVDKARGSRGLGLISMEERAHLMHGSFSIESCPGAGTRILVRVPWARPSDGGAMIAPAKSYSSMPSKTYDGVISRAEVIS